MRVLLISPNREEINMPAWPLGLACVAAATTRAGHEVKVLDLMLEDQPRLALEQVIETFRPGVIGVSLRNIDDQSMENTKFMLDRVKEVISLCKAVSDAAVVLGGAGYSVYPESALDYLGADMGIQGEGEVSFVDLLARIERKEDLSGLPGLFVRGRGPQGKRSFVKNLDELPLPDPRLFSHLVYENGDFWLPVQTRRGCPFNCSYCSTATIEGCIIRKRSPKAVVQWLGEWAKLGVHRFFFVDNTFNLPPSYAKTLCLELAAANLNAVWRCIIYPRKLDEDLVRAMAQAGCKEVSLGFESGSELILHGMNKRFKPDDVRAASELLARHGISRMGFLLLGGPGETKESALESLAFADSLNPDAMKVSIGIRIYPYTALAETALKEGVIDANDDLLAPRFYVVRGLEDWLYQTVRDWTATRPNWLR